MSRPLSKGRTIGIRLPLTVDAAVRERASAAGLSPGAYLADRVTKSLTGSAAPATVRPESNRRTGDSCAHKTATPIAGGMMKCSECGKVRGAGGVWRSW